MKRIIRYFRCGWVAWAVLLLLFSACSKLDVEYGPISYADPGEGGYYNSGPNSNDLGIGTIRTYGLQRYVRLDDSTIGMIVYPIRAILDFVFMHFVDTPKRMPLFYMGAVLYLAGFLMFPIFGASTVTYVLTQLLYCIGAVQ